MHKLFERIANKMSRPIPQPAKPKPKPAKSWRRLKPGQVLVLKDGMRLGPHTIFAGTEFSVLRVNSLGADLIVDDICLEVQEYCMGNEFRLTNPDWTKQFQLKKGKKNQ